MGLLMAAVVLVIILYVINRPAQSTKEDGTRRDSITVAKNDIDWIKAERAVLRERIKADSIFGVEKDLAHEKQVAALERRIRAINRQHATPGVLDSIRLALYPDGTDIDSAYVMPLSAARECLQAAERLPLTMALVDTLKGRIVDLKAEKAMDRALFASLDSSQVAEIGKNQVIIRNLGEMLSDCEGKKKRFWPRVWATVKDVAKVGAGFVLGRL